MASTANANGSTNASTSVTQSPSTQDSLMDDPLFLHHAENPSLVLVTQPLIGGENYAAWARAVRKALLTKNKLGFIDGTLTLSSSLTNGPRIFNLQKDITELHQGEMSVTNFFTQLKVFWDQLQNLSPFPSCTYGKCICNINKRLTDLQVRESVVKFLMGLKDSFSQVRSQVLLMDPIPSLSMVYSLLIQEETQRSVPNASVAKVDSTALVVKLSNEHLGPNLGNSGGKGKERPTCTFCGKTGHTVDKCYKKHGFPPGFKFKNRPPMAHQVSSDVLPTTSPLHHQNSAFTPEQCQQLLALFGASTSSLAVASTSPKETPMANVASSSASASVRMSGIDLSHSVFFAQVVNRRAYDKRTWVLDTGATDHFDLLSWKTIGVGKAVDGLYLLQCDTLQHISFSSLADYLINHKFHAAIFHPFSAANSATTSPSSSHLWHARLGHPSDLKLRLLGHHIPSLQSPCNKTCQVCPMAKRKRLPFPFNNNISACAFDLVHMDVWGPYSVPTLDGFKYFLTIVDDATRATCDVVFHEFVFPYASSSNSSLPAIPLPLPCVPSIPPLHDDPIMPSHSTPILSFDSIIQVHHILDDDFLDDLPEAPLEPIADPFPFRRSSRSVKRPSYLQEFHCNQVATDQPMHSSHSVVSDPQWQAVMAAEIVALEANNTWTLTPLPAGKKPIGCEWVYTIKYKDDGLVKRYKAKLVAKGFTQMKGVDYFETFSPIAKMVSVSPRLITHCLLEDMVTFSWFFWSMWMMC
ncbi:uncharacterized protein LOC142629146 [Castanea sativa]|uniref:uncharacterized protein LOC142629146 n=1 Tax=Castanea sativa TaxID=21020 RepID=UPI003F64AEFC